MNDLIISNILLLINFTSNKLKCVRKFLLTIGKIEEFIEREHLIYLIRKLVTLSPRDQLMRTFTTQFKSTLRCKSVFWCVNHCQLFIVKLLCCQEVDF